MTLHRVFGAGQPYTQDASADGTPFIRLCSVFYLLAGQTWPCVGGRVHIPGSASVLSTGIRIMAWTGAHESPIDIGASPLRQVETTTPPAAGWCEVSWAPFDVIGGTTAVAIGYEFLTQVSTYLFTSSTLIGPDPVQAADGSPLYLAEQAYTGGRSRFKVGAGGVGSSSSWYGPDVVLDDGVSTGPEPLTAKFNGQVGTLWAGTGSGCVPVIGAKLGT